MLLQTAAAMDDRLLENLKRRGFCFLNGGDEHAPWLEDAAVLAGLVASQDARVRSVLIAWLLAQPVIHGAGPAVAAQMGHATPLAYHNFIFFYTAAHYLQRIYAPALWVRVAQWVELPNYFAAQCGVNVGDVALANRPEQMLTQLAQQHARIGNASVNWLGTYHHAVRMVLRLSPLAAQPLKSPIINHHQYE